MKKIPPTVSLVLKALVSVGILVFLLTRVDITRLLQILSTAQPAYLVVALVGYFAGQIVSSVRWTLLARPLGLKNPYSDFVSYYFIGMFFNLFAPGTVGGDLGRVFYLARGQIPDPARGWTGSTTSALISVVMDRVVGMVALVWLATAALLLFPAYSLPRVIHYITHGLTLGFILGWFMLPLFQRMFERRSHAIGQNLSLAITAYRHNQQVVAQTILLSLIVHFIQASIQLYLGRALAVEIPFSYCFILYPLVGLFSAIPISLNGFGLREGGYLFLLQLVGISSEKAIAFGLLWFVIVALDSLFGGVLFLLRRAPKPSAVISE